MADGCFPSCAAQNKRPERRVRRSGGCFCSWLVAVGHDHRGDQATGHRGQHIVVVDLAPFIAARRTLEVTVLPVMDALGAIPIVAVNAAAPAPVMMAIVGVAVIAI